MGYALAAEASKRGAKVQLVSGPTHLEPPPNVRLTRVRSAAEMAQAVFESFATSDIVVKAAAVGDYRPSERQAQKLKKDKEEWVLALTKTTDILSELGRKKEHQVLVGFAAESENLWENAKKKLEAKSLDLIIANDISESGSGFASDVNRVVLIDIQGGQEQLPLLPKKEVAAKVWDKIEQLCALRPAER
jgi:phosphopantothenoylcysteine decarboxylase/phosphopantothenate--cysteine ligase